MTHDPESTKSTDYRALVAGEISSEEYALRLKAAVAAEEEASARDAERRTRIGELVRGPSVFLSYAHEDRDIARTLAVELEKRGAAVWIDQGELRIGDSIIERVSAAITEVDYIVVLVSATSVASPWVAKELSLAATRVLARQGVKVLPVRIGNVPMPPSLGDILYLQLNANDVAGAADKIYRDLLSHQEERDVVPRTVEPPAATSEPWTLPIPALVQQALVEVRQSDTVALSAHLNGLPRAFAAAVHDKQDVDGVLDRLASLVAAFAGHEQDQWAAKYAKGFERVYNDVFDVYGIPKAGPDRVSPQELWLGVIVRLEAVGALAIRLQKWSLVRQLALTPVTGERPPYNPFALRHGLTMAARANLFDQREGNKEVQLSLLVMARDLVERLEPLVIDFPGNEEAVLNSLCQFDVLAALTAIGVGGSPDTRFYYTNFARFNTWRSEPAIRRLIEDPSVRAELFDGSDDDLALAVRVIDRLATREAFRFNGWDEIRDPIIVEFLAQHPQDEKRVNDTRW